MRIKESISEAEADLKNIHLLKDLLNSIKEFPISKLDQLESTRKWTKDNEIRVKKKIQNLKNIQKLIKNRTKWFTFILYILVSVNSLSFFIGTYRQKSIISTISFIFIFSLATCSANPGFKVKPILTAIFLPFAAILLLYNIPLTKSFIDGYPSAVTFLGVIYSVLLIVLGKNIDDT